MSAQTEDSCKYRCRRCLELVTLDQFTRKHFIHTSDEAWGWFTLFDAEKSQVDDDWCIANDWFTGVYKCLK